jgi:uracil-DNA glycosylase family 4
MQELAQLVGDLRALVQRTAGAAENPREPSPRPRAVLAAPPASAGAAPPAAPQPGVAVPESAGAVSLDALDAALQNCQRCKLSTHRTTVVFGNGPAQARLMFVGEAPGPNEDLQGQPFVGEAGKLLNKMIAAMGLRREAVYVANLVKCRPPRNRDPEPDEVAQCEPFLHQQIGLVKPVVLVGLGRYAVQALLQEKQRIGQLRGIWRTYRGIPLMPTFHPAYLLRNPADKKKVWADLQQVMARLGLSRT